MYFYKHQMETEEQHIKRISEKIQKIMQEEGVAFDVQMIPQIRMVVVPEVKEVKKDDPTNK